MPRRGPKEEIAAEAALREERLASAATLVSLNALREHAAGLRRAQLMAGLAHVITKPDGSFESWSETLPLLLGIKEQEVVPSTRRWLDLIHPSDRAHFRAAALEGRATGNRVDIEYRIWRADGAWIHVRQAMEPIPGKPDSEGRRRWFNTLQDITPQKHAEERIRRLNRIYAVLSGINSLIVRTRDRDALFRQACDLAVNEGGLRMAWIGLVNEARTRITPVAWAGEAGNYLRALPLSLEENAADFGLAGRALKALAPVVSEDIQRDGREQLKEEAAALGIASLAKIPLIHDGKALGILCLYAADPGHFDAEEMRLLVELAGDVAFAMDYLDKSEQAKYLAYYDPVTRLANRTLFHERLVQFVQAAGARNEKLAVALVDLERFKTLNDTLGRQAGDAVLRAVGERFTAAVPNVRVSRLGSDQFAIVVPNAGDVEALGRRIEMRLRQMFGTPYLIGARELRLSARMGISMYPDDGVDADALVRNAEAALKKAKEGGEAYLFYEQRMSERVSENLALENKLRRAVEEEQFVLHYQPKIDLETRAVTGVEALIRWQDPETGLVPPIKFIPILERTGLILQVGTWALKRAALDHRAWTTQGLAAPRVAVNVSPIQLRQRAFVTLVEEALAAGISPTGIDLEITESLLMEDIQASIQKLRRLRELGVSIAIDDFGTGYSSLAYLARLPVQALKVDRSFISTMQDSADATTLVSTMISLAHSMRLKVVAEGVETEEQAKILRLLRCDEMQGYLFSKPLPVDALVALLKKQAPAR